MTSCLFRPLSCVLLVAVLVGCGEVEAPFTDGGVGDECALGTDDCQEVVGVCTDTAESFTCSCLPGFLGTGQGEGSCLWDDAALTDLVPSEGATLSPAFSPSTTMYTATLPPGVTSPTLTPTTAQPSRTEITVAGTTVLSGASAAVSLGFAPTVVDVVVTAESGTTRTYTVIITRGTANYVKASNTAASDHFGSDVSLSADGTRLAVGADGEDSSAIGVNNDQGNDAASGSGAVYVFVRSGATWTQEAYLKASNTGSSEAFGGRVALSADGTRLAVGAENENSATVLVNGDQSNNNAASSGAVYVFSRTGTTWAQEAYVKASNTGIADFFGNALALSGDGTRLAVGAYFEDSAAVGVNGSEAEGGSGSGAVYVYARTGTTWVKEAYVKATNTNLDDQFGIAVALSGDGSRLAVGAYAEDSNAVGVNNNQLDNNANFAGAVYVYLRTGTAWAPEAYLKASNTGASDLFGQSVSMSADGTRLAVGAPGESSSATGVNGDQADNGTNGSGAVYVFARTTTTWAQEAYVKASNPGNSDGFGRAVSLSPDGGRLGVGAQSEDSVATGIDGNQLDQGAGDSGAAYLFSRTGTTWVQEVYVKSTNTDGNDIFGATVSLSADPARFAVGAQNESSSATGLGGDGSNNAATQSGAAYVY